MHGTLAHVIILFSYKFKVVTNAQKNKESQLLHAKQDQLFPCLSPISKAQIDSLRSMGGVKIPNYTYFTCSIPRKDQQTHKKLLQVAEFLIIQPIAKKYTKTRSKHYYLISKSKTLCTLYNGKVKGKKEYKPLLRFTYIE